MHRVGSPLGVKSWLHCNAQVKLPLDVGTIVEARWRDGKRYAARVIERRLSEGSSQHQYYVHYLRCESCLLHRSPVNSFSTCCSRLETMMLPVADCQVV